MPASGDRNTGRDIVVVGASAGGVEALSLIVAQLPNDFPASVFVVLHLASAGTSVLPAILSRKGPLPATHGIDGEQFERSHIYVAPVDHHMVVQNGTIEVARGPRENGHRPAIDPLFRSAAAAYDGRVIGVVLSGVLDDGASGLRAVKLNGGSAVVQDPADALYSMMPESALHMTTPDRVLPASEIAAALVELTREPPGNGPGPNPGHGLVRDEFIRLDRAASDKPQPGRPSGLSCPDCGGVLWETELDEFTQFRCRVGHAYSVDSFLNGHTEKLETSLWSALNALEERAAILRRLAARMQGRGMARLARRYAEQADAALEDAARLRQALERVEAPTPLADVAGGGE